MGYLKEFQTQILNRDFNKFMTLWEEYCTSDNVPSEELNELIQMIKKSDFAKPMGAYVETIIPIWRTVQDPNASYTILKGIIDIQTTQTQELYDLVLEKSKERYGQKSQFNDILKIAGLKSKDNFTGTLSFVDVLAHLEAGQFLLHPGGWGIGEIMELSHLREQVTLEFENLSGRKSLSYSHAMRLLIPVPKTHFLSRRFSKPDELEKEARANPVKVIKDLLSDLGPKTAQEIKDEMADLVIPEDEFSKWWSQARSKLKKDLLVDTPDSLKGVFSLRSQQISHEDKLMQALSKKKKAIDILQTLHSYSKEEASTLKKEEVKNYFEQTLKKVLAENLPPKDRLQGLFIALNTLPQNNYPHPETILKNENDLIALIDDVEILQIKKQALMWIRENKSEWIPLFLDAIKRFDNVLIREYLMKELSADKEGRQVVEKAVKEILNNPSQNPEWFFWLFNRVILSDKDDLLLSDHYDNFWEGLLLLLSQIENSPSYQELVKKILNVIIAERYKAVRDLFKQSTYEFTKEFLLYASKSHSIEDHDQKSLRSLAAVHYPELALKSDEEKAPYVLWTTEEGYIRSQKRVEEIATKEMVDNAREIEAARALGDLRENSEYKFAKERRARLQGEMRRLADDIKKARVITPPDTSKDEVAVGSVVKIEDPKGTSITYKILGPWDADVEGKVLSFQSKLAQAMLGKRAGETFQFKDEKYKIESLKTIFD
jgi:transcription elongation factor GreA-like protein/transcription elongation GreA/GreB family factor